MMPTLSYTPQQLREKIIHEKIPTSSSGQPSTINVWYSLCKKLAAKISIISNDRLLIYNQNEQIIYYVNYTQNIKCPFGSADKVPSPKNDFAQLVKCIFKRQAKDSNILMLTFNISGENGKVDCVEWSFAMENQRLAAQWESFILDQKKNVVLRFLISPSSSFLKLDQHEPDKSEKPPQIKQKAEDNSKQQVHDSRLESSPKGTQDIKQKQQLLAKLRAVDWNMKLIQKHESATIQQFQQYAGLEFSADIETSGFIAKLVDKCATNSIRVDKKFVVIYYTLCGSQAAKHLTEEFENYHYIIRCCQDQHCPSVRVPLACLIETKGIFCMMKAKFPQSAKIIQGQAFQEKNPQISTVNGLFKQLETFTKIQTSALKTQCIVLNLSNDYGLEQGLPRIYIDEVTSYLPYYPQPDEPYQFIKLPERELVAAEVILQNFQRSIQANSLQAMKEINYYVEQSVKEMVEYLKEEEKLLVGYQDLKQLMASCGLKMSLLPQVRYYLDIITKKQILQHVKMLITQSLICELIVKSHVKPMMRTLLESNELHLMKPSVESIVRKVFETNSVISQQFWKELRSDFETLYRYFITMRDVHPEILLDCLMNNIVAQFDLSKFKKVGESERKIEEGFILQLGTNIRSYSQLSNTKERTIMQFCSHEDINNIHTLQNEGMLTQILKQPRILRKANLQKYLQYLSIYISPFQEYDAALVQSIFECMLKGPLNSHSFAITLNYLKHYSRSIAQSNPITQQQVKVNSYLLFLEKVKNHVDYWLGSEHVSMCQVLLQFAHFYYSQNDIPAAEKYLLASINICRKQYGLNSLGAARGLQQLGTLLIKAGFIKQSGVYLKEAKSILGLKSIKNDLEYAELLNCLAGYELAAGNEKQSQSLVRASMKLLQQKKSFPKSSVQVGSRDRNFSNKILYENLKILVKLCQIGNQSLSIKSVLNGIDQLMRQQQDWNIFREMVTLCVSGVVWQTKKDLGQKHVQYFRQLALKIVKPNDETSPSLVMKKMKQITQNQPLPEYMIKKLGSITKNLKNGVQRSEIGSLEQEMVEFIENLSCCVGRSFLEEL